MSKINLRNFVSQHYKRGVTARDVVLEAITNSIHADATTVNIQLVFSESPQKVISEIKDTNSVLTKIIITDNGDGFIKKNLDSFNEVCSTHKNDVGGKGVGRLSFLKLAQKINIVSYNKDNESVKFDYNYDFNLEKVSTQTFKQEEGYKKSTEITISEIIKPVNTKVDVLINSLCDDLRLILFLKQQAGTSIDLNFIHNSNQKFESPFKYQCGKDDSLDKKEFTVCGETFECYLFKDAPPEKGITAIYCADSLGIEKYTVSKKFDTCKYSIFITSDYFNQCANIERQGLELLENHDNDNQNIDDFILEESNPNIKKNVKINRKILELEIHMQCMEMVEKYAQNDINSFKENNFKKIKTYYPYIKIESLGSNAKLLDADAMVREHRKNQANKEDQLINSLEKGIPLQNIFEDVSHLACDDLARYICHRTFVVDSLSNMPSDSLEKVLHNNFITKNSNGNGLYENNLWLLDDKFLSYSSVHSDEILTNIIKKVDIDFKDSESERPDVAIFFSKDNNNKPNKLVIIEFKKFLADKYDKGKALQQCRTYASELVENLPSILEVFCFALVEIDDKFYRDLKQTNYKDIFSRSERILYQDFSIGIDFNIPMHQYVMPVSALLLDAKSRNKLFENILKQENF